jgi:hypothetical protein
MIIFRNRVLMWGEEAGAGGGAGGGSGGGDDKTVLVTAARDAAKKAGTFLVDDWRESLPEDIAKDGSLGSLKTHQDFVKSYINQRKVISGNKIALPGDNAKPEEWGEFFKKLGRPDDPTAYDLAGPEKPPTGYNYPKALETDFRKWAHENGLNGKQTKAMWGKIVERTVKHHNDTTGTLGAQRQKDMDALKTDWGANYNGREELAKKAFRALNRAAGKDHAMPEELLQNPRFLRAFAHIGEMANEDRLGEGKGSPGGTMSATEAISRIAEIQGEKGGPYWDQKHPGYKRTQEEVKNLYAIAYPDKTP